MKGRCLMLFLYEAVLAGATSYRRERWTPHRRDRLKKRAERKASGAHRRHGARCSLAKYPSVG